MNIKEPIYRVIEKDLRKQILDGSLKQNDMLPSEIELCKRYNVSRMTVRQAINNLFFDGYIYRHKGRGTFVAFNKKEMEQNGNTAFFSFTKEMIKDQAELKNYVIEFAIQEPDEAVASKLCLKEGEKVYYVERLRKANNVPLAYERIYLPLHLFPNLHKDNFKDSFHNYCQDELHFTIRNQQTAIEARMMAKKVAEILNCTTDDAALYMSSVSYLIDGSPFMYSRQYFLGTHFRFRHNYQKK